MRLEIEMVHRFAGFSIDARFKAPKGVTALFGRSGAGKTTVINAVAGLLRPHAGLIRIGDDTLVDTNRGIDTPVSKRRIGYVFQDARLFPHLTVRRNLLFSGWFDRETKAWGHSRLPQVVDLLGIDHLLDRHPATLSGGEKQRVAIGRALLSRPRILLMDEPLAALDDARKAEILPYIERLRDELDIPILYVSHSVPEIARLATTIVAMSEGRVVRSGPATDILADPDTFPVMGRQEAGSILAVTVLSHDVQDGLSELGFDGGRIWVPLVEAAPGAEFRIRVRARDVILALREPSDTSALNILPVTVQAVGLKEGAIVDVAVRCGGSTLLARITRRSLERLDIREGVSCFAVLKSVAVGRRDLGLHNARRSAKT